MSEAAISPIDSRKSLGTLAGLALRLLRRDWRGGEIQLLFIALVMAVTSVTGIALFTDRLEKALLLESANMLAADRALSSRQQPPQEILAEAEVRGFHTAQTLTFTSMAFSESSNMLVSAKAVSDAYPLRGEVIVADRLFAQGAPIVGGPLPGEVWLESRALSALNIEVGDPVFIGEAELIASKIIVVEPDRQQAGMLDSVGPRLMLSMADVEKTNVVQLGSRVSYRYLFASDDQKALDAFAEWIREKYNGNYSVRDVRDESEAVNEALDKAESFLLLGSLLAALLAGVAIAFTAKRYSENHYDYVAILKSLGCTSVEVGFIYLFIQSALAIISIVLGCALGWLLHQVILRMLQSIITVELPAIEFEPFVIGSLTALVCLLSFALPPLLALRATPPLRVLRKDLGQKKIGAYIPYLFGMAGTLFLVFWYSQSLVLTAVLVISVAGIAIVLFFISYFLLRSGGAVGMKAGSVWKLAMVTVRRRRKQNVLQIMVFSITIMSLLILTSLRADLIDDWQRKLPENTPNHFLMNITEPQIEGVEAFFAENGVNSNAFYPLISARVIHVNGVAPESQQRLDVEDERSSVVDGVQSDENKNTMQSGELATSLPTSTTDTEVKAEEQGAARGRLTRRQVTWADELPPDNLVTAGNWWDENPAAGYVSIEDDYASWLNIEIGDIVEFEINQQIVVAEVSSLRSVRWDNMQPNFFIIFSPGTIDHLGGTFLSTALLERDQKSLLNDLVRLFPTMVVIEVDALIEQIQNIIAQVTSAIELISVLVLVSGALVLLACVNATLDERFYENAILRTLGAGKKLILTSLLIEFASIGALAGLVATIGAEASLYYLQEHVFEQEFSMHYWIWVAGPLLGMIIVAGLGLNSTRQVVSTSPLNVLRRVA